MVALRELAGNAGLRRTITVMVDSVDHLDFIANATASAGPVRVSMDIDCTLRVPGIPGLAVGPRRFPIRTPKQARALAAEILRRPPLRLVGMMGYEGQVASVADAEKGLTGAFKRLLRSSSMAQVVPRRADCVAAGSGFYTPVIFDQFYDIDHVPAAFFVCPVVRILDAGWATINSGGWIASGPPAADRVPVPVHPAGLNYSATEGPGKCKHRCTVMLPAPCASAMRCGSAMPRREKRRNT